MKYLYCEWTKYQPVTHMRRYQDANGHSIFTLNIAYYANTEMM